MTCYDDCDCDRCSGHRIRVRELTERAEAAERERDAALGVMRSVEWEYHGHHGGVDQCPACHGDMPGEDMPEATGHTPDCPLAACLRGGDGKP